MRTKEEIIAAKNASAEKKIGYSVAIEKLQERLRMSEKISKTNPNDAAIQNYQNGRQTELRYAIHLLLTPRQSLEYSRSQNQKAFMTRRKLANPS